MRILPRTSPAAFCSLALLLPSHLDSLTNDAHTDMDGDGSSNITEFLAGTNPGSISDYFRIVQHQILPSGFSMRFTSVAGRRYEIQNSTDCVNWSVVPGLEDVLASTESGETTSVDTRPQPQRRFYRVAVKPIGF